MKLLDLTLPDPASNLACDEALLDAGEAGGDAVLRFWESPDYFVVIGYANHVAREVNGPACARRRVPILRRCSGGGTVLQGPGCLNYALILPAPSASVTDTNRFIMNRHRDALSRLLGRPVTFDGHTDLALDGKKFSGNSQRRRKHCILFHGTFLLDFDLPLVEELLRMPSNEPAYRQHRAHGEFLANLNRPAPAIKTALRQVWGATDQLAAPPADRIAELVTEKYATRAWNEKF